MSDIVIRAEGLGKRYLIGHQSAERERYTALRDVVGQSLRGLGRSALNMMRNRQIVAGDEVEEFWALKDVSFEIKRGEVVGIIGRNGAGKSTLLKILARITEPSAGRVEIKGRLASLLEVGTGFHPELTGRENIYLNGAILGMSRAEIRKKFDEIVAFAEVAKFLDTPVKRYSSGMYVRLAFAVAAHLEPEILIVDEVLAVGDAEFQRKCLGKMQDVASHGRTVLFVSHNSSALSALCSFGVLFSAGAVVAKGAISNVLQQYLSSSAELSSIGSLSKTSKAGIENVSVSKEKKDALDFEISLVFGESEYLRELCILCYSTTGVRVFVCDLRAALGLPRTFPPGEYRIKAMASPVSLVEIEFSIGLFVETDGFSGNLLSLRAIALPPVDSGVVGYPAENRGFVNVGVSADLRRLDPKAA